MNYYYLRLYTESLRFRDGCLVSGTGWFKFGVPKFEMIAWLPSLRKTYLISLNTRWSCNNSKI